MLYCTVCKHLLEEGIVQCNYCRNGYGSPLACVTCHQNVVPGSSGCATCSPNRGQQLRRIHEAREDDSRALVTSAIPMPTLVVPETYSHGRFGVHSEVQMNGRDAEILNKMSQVATLLHGLALEMGGLQGHLPSTRNVIKSCRNLATDLQEEIEVRVGPRG